MKRHWRDVQDMAELERAKGCARCRCAKHRAPPQRRGHRWSVTMEWLREKGKQQVAARNILGSFYNGKQKQSLTVAVGARGTGLPIYEPGEQAKPFRRSRSK